MLEINRLTFTRFLPFAAGFSAIAYALLGFACSTISLTCFGVAFMFLRMAFLPISDLHSTVSGIMHYLTMISQKFMGWILIERSEKATKNPAETQRKLLMDLLRVNKDTEFGLKHGFAYIKNQEVYRQKVPLTTYADYKAYVDRLEMGEQNLLTKARVERLTVSSGTTGKCKLLPCTSFPLKAMLLGFVFPLFYRIEKAKKLPAAPLKTLEISFIPKWRYSQAGLPIGPVSALPGKQPYMLSALRTTPPEAMAQVNEDAQLYVHFYFGLYDREIRYISASFGGTFLSCLEFLRQNWKKLADDIRQGRFTNHHQIPEDFFQSLKPMPPNPKRALEIENAFNVGYEGVVKRLWPRVDYVFSVTTGSHIIFRQRIQYYCGPEIQVLACVYGSSETPIAVSMSAKQDRDFTYTMNPTWSFFEFIPEDLISATENEPKTLLLEELELGRRYEIVVTSANGFYRYRMGDIVKVTDFHHETPVVEFCSRVGSILDLRGEKTTEDMVLKALRNTKWPENGQVVEFSTTNCLSLADIRRDDDDEDDDDDGLYYVFFVELDRRLEGALLDSVEMALDEALCNASYPYKSFRVKQAIRRLKLFTVTSGTFEHLKKFILRRNETISNQYKTPHYTTDGDVLKLLYGRIHNDDD